jgi:hypothetical protein
MSRGSKICRFVSVCRLQPDLADGLVPASVPTRTRMKCFLGGSNGSPARALA